MKIHNDVGRLTHADAPHPLHTHAPGHTPILFKGILDNMVEGCQVIDFKWRYIYLNTTALQQAQQEKRHLLGSTIMECYPDIEDTPMFKQLNRCMKDRTPCSVESLLTHPGGKQRWLELHMEPVPEGVLILSVDIHDRKTAEAALRRHTEKFQRINNELQKFKQAVDSASDMIFILGKKGDVIYANPSCERVTGYSTQDILGKEAAALWNTPIPEAFFARLWHTVRDKKQIFEDDIRNTRKNGNTYDAHITVSPVLDANNDIEFYVGIERDISQEKEVERAKNEFVSLASHQLRTPPSIINWSVEELQQDAMKELQNDQRRLLRQIFQANQRMIKLVDAMLNISRMELGTFTVTPEMLNLPALLESELAGLQQQISHKNLHVRVHCQAGLPELRSDKNLFQIILQNLLVNAIKYTPANGKIRVDVTHTQKLLKLSVSDTGCGIPAHQQDRIFTKLFRADNARILDTDGTGLGLYLVKSLVDFMKGKVWFTSTENKGTTFYLTIPLEGLPKKDGVTQLVKT